ncbi:hypothetical protein B0H14DRAFT_2592380 [Mycena olivaceomarginata]|nr:hypothetical protein B0H14DRAFT_2592380 [Mycena olivaceomarginata]
MSPKEDHSVSYGRSRTALAPHWPQWDKPRFAENVTKFMIEFLGTAFTPQECQQSALNPGASADLSGAKYTIAATDDSDSDSDDSDDESESDSDSDSDSDEEESARTRKKRKVETEKPATTTKMANNTKKNKTAGSQARTQAPAQIPATRRGGPPRISLRRLLAAKSDPKPMLKSMPDTARFPSYAL